MFTVEKEIKFCFGHRLMGYPGKCSQAHGHNGRAIIVIEQESLDELGMVMDFKELKRKVVDWIDESLDHSMILQTGDPLIDSLTTLGMVVYETADPPTTENIAKLIYDKCREMGIPASEVRFWETDASLAAYRADANKASEAARQAVAAGVID